MKYDVKNMKSYLRKNDISKVELMGVMGIIIISKDVIRKNADVGEDNIENEKISDGAEKTIRKVKKENENDKLKKWLKGL